MGTEKKCENCFLFQSICVCQFLSPIETRTSIVVVAHRKELFKVTNTGRLACLNLTNSHLISFGEKDKPLDLSDFKNNGKKNYLLFPSEHAVPLDQIKPPESHVNLFLPDGNWRQAKKIANRLSRQMDFVSVKLPPGPPGEYQIRYHPDTSKICTIEAIMRSLQYLEPEVKLAALKNLFLLMRDRLLWKKGSIKLEQIHSYMESSINAPQQN